MECGYGSTLNETLYVFDLDMEQWYWWNPTLQQYQPCEGTTEEQISLPTLQDNTAIVGTREEDKAVYPILPPIPTLINKTLGH